MRSVFGQNIIVTLEGESHGPRVKCRAVGVPAGISVDAKGLEAFMSRRRGGQRGTTPRREADVPEFLSGLSDSVTDGAELVISIPNQNTRSGDYAGLTDTPRPSHADYTAPIRFPGCDMRGGGHFSARLTAPLCALGYICKCALAERGIRIGAHLRSVGDVADDPFDPVKVSASDFVGPDQFPARNSLAAELMQKRIDEAAAEGDSVGGVVECAVIGCPAGIGSPLAAGIENRVSEAMFILGGLRGIEFGSGFEASEMRGSVHNDPFVIREGRVATETNNSGGVQAGITNGMPVIFRCAFKPTASISRPQKTVSLSGMKGTEILLRGRHDPCIAVRAVACVEALTAIVVLDAMLDRPGETLEECRREIDVINDRLTELLCRRLEVAGRIADIKKSMGHPILDAVREGAILERVRDLADEREPGTGSAVAEIFHGIMRVTREHERARTDADGSAPEEV